MSDNPAAEISGLHHFSLTVTDIDASIAWYTRLFGLKKVPVTFPHYDREETGHGVLLTGRKSGLVIGLHINASNDGTKFDEARTGLDHVSFRVRDYGDLEMWVQWLGQLGIRHSGIRHEKSPFDYSTVVFRDPDGIQLELIALGGKLHGS